jgi:hypothetical protein
VVHTVRAPEADRNATPVACPLAAAGLLGSFGCVDLIRHPETGAWLVLEVGTDGVHNHVDRDIGDAGFERELLQRIVGAFWRG